MPRTGTLEVEINVTGNLPVIAHAFGIMSDALVAYGHQFTGDERVTIREAGAELSKALEPAPEEV